MKQYTENKSSRIGTCLTALAAGILVPLVPAPATAVILRSGQDNVVPPPDDPGFYNVSDQGRSLVYLGDSWVLTAFHVGEPNDGFHEAHFAGEAYDIIPNSAVALHNPEGLGLTELTDLRMFRINGNPDLPSLRISTSPPPIGVEVTLIGRGRARQDDPTHWDVQMGSDRWRWTETSGWGNYRGFKLDPNGVNQTRWGTNRIEDDFKVTGETDPGHTTVVEIRGGGGKDVIAVLTLWDETGGTAHEAQAVAGDSGGGVFYKRGGRWELAGIMNAVFEFPNQRPDWSVYGQATAFADLSVYRSEILSIMDDPNYSIMGDINLDGVVSGDGSGGPDSDDLAAFVAGWSTQHAVPNIDSWKMGDINQDAVTDLHDFRLLRGAHPGAAAIAPALGIAVAGVPEPATWALLSAGAVAGWFATRRRFRSCRPVLRRHAE